MNFLLPFEGGAIGRIHSPNASAEIEGEESELVSIDTPLAPQRDLIALLKQTTAVPIDQSKIALRSFFIAVDEERFQSSNTYADHVRDLMERYQGQDESKLVVGLMIVSPRGTRTVPKRRENTFCFVVRRFDSTFEISIFFCRIENQSE